MKKYIAIALVLLSVCMLHAQTDTMYVMKYGVLKGKYNVKTELDSVIFYNPVITTISSNKQTVLQTDTMYVMKGNVVMGKYNVNNQLDSIIFNKPEQTLNTINYVARAPIPAGSFKMGSPFTEPFRQLNETLFAVTLGAFQMSKYEITNAQYAAFLNAKNIGSDGLYAAGTYPMQALIHANSSWGLIYNGTLWVPVAGFETSPVINVTWFGAAEFSTYIGGKLPTEAQWEYACRATSTTPYSTGNILTNLQSNYNWANPYNAGTNSASSSLGKTQPSGSYAPNAYGLFEMHGNVWEWCSDWYDTYPTSAQTNPTGASKGLYRVVRGGGWSADAQYCRSAYRGSYIPETDYRNIGFRVVFVP